MGTIEQTCQKGCMAPGFWSNYFANLVYHVEGQSAGLLHLLTKHGFEHGRVKSKNCSNPIDKYFLRIPLAHSRSSSKCQTELLPIKQKVDYFVPGAEIFSEGMPTLTVNYC